MTTALLTAPPVRSVPSHSACSLTDIVDAFPETLRAAAAGFVAGTLSWCDLLQEICDGYLDGPLVPIDIRFLAAQLMAAVDANPVTSVVEGSRLLCSGWARGRRYSRQRKTVPKHQRGHLPISA